MTESEIKLREFREALKNDILNGNIELRVTKQENPSYKADVKINLSGCDMYMAVAQTFICYHNDVLSRLFTEDEIVLLNEIVDEYLTKNKEKYDRIEALKKELNELEKEVA